MTKSSNNKESASEQNVHVTVDNREVWLPKECEKCHRLLKTRKGYENHISKCDKEAKAPRPVLTEEERIARRKAGVQRWVDSNECIQIRLKKDSDDLAFLNARVEEMRKVNPEAKRIGSSTYFLKLLADDIKKVQRKTAKSAKK